MDSDGKISEHKPRGNMRRVLTLVGWVWAALLIIMLISAVIIQAPWKVTGLIAVLLAAATILPRRFRKWFWAGVGAVVLAVIVWIFLPSDNEGWRPYTFDKELAELQARYAVPDAENAAIIYNQILETWKQKEANEPNLPGRWFNLVSRGPWLGKDQPEIAAYLKYHQDTIEELLRATRFEKCLFPIVADTFDIGADMDRHSAMRQWGHLLIAAGNNNMAEGGTNKAVEKYLAALRIGQHACRQPNNIDILVGFACESLGLGGINNFVVWGDANELYLGKLEQAVSSIRHDWSSDLSGVIDSEKLMLKNMWGGSSCEVNSKGKVRLSRDPSAKIREDLKKQLANGTIDDPETKAELQKAIICPGYWQRKLMKAYTILTWFFMPETPEKLGGIIDASFEKHYQMARPDFDWSKKPHNEQPNTYFKLNLRYFAKFMVQITRDFYFGLHDRYLQSSARQKGTLLIIALRRYKNTNGHWPETLDDIASLAPAEIFVDPVNRDSFVYRVTDEDFTLYSIGKNGIDDGGKRDSKTEDTVGPDDLVIWPRPAKTKAVQDKND